MKINRSRSLGRRKAPWMAMTKLAMPLAVALAATLVFNQRQVGASAGSDIYVTTIDGVINDDAECSLAEAIYSANYNDNVAPDPSRPLEPEAFITTGCVDGSDGVDRIVLQAFWHFTFTDPIATFPALSLAVQVTVFTPAVAVLTESQSVPATNDVIGASEAAS